LVKSFLNGIGDKDLLDKEIKESDKILIIPSKKSS